MKNLNDVLDEVKKVTKSDYRTTKELGITTQLISNWRARRSMPSNKHVIAMCDLAKIDLREAILAIEYSREYERPMREAGYADIGMITSLTCMSLAVVSPTPEALAGAAIGSVILGSIHYAKYKKACYN